MEVTPAMSNQQSDQKYVERLMVLDTCVVSDALDAKTIEGVATGIRRLATDKKIAGQAVTVRLEEANGRKADRHLCTGAIETATSGNIIVVEHHARYDCAGWGGLLSRAAAYKNLAGTIVDGMCRDIDESRDIDYPIFARGGVPATARNRVMETAFNIDVKIGGVNVSPGDFILADGSGLVFVPVDKIDEILELAEGFFAREQSMLKLIEQGLPVGEVMAGNYERMLEKT